MFHIANHSWKQFTHCVKSASRHHYFLAHVTTGSRRLVRYCLLWLAHCGRSDAAALAVQVAAASPSSTASGTLTDEEALEEEVSPDGSLPKSKSKFKKFLKKLTMTKTKDGKDRAATAAKSQSSTAFLSRDNSAGNSANHSTTLRC